eukprot:c19625_g1_i1 orf=328-2562(-)
MGETVDSGQMLVELSPIEYCRKRLRHGEHDSEQFTGRSGKLRQVDETLYTGLNDNDVDILLDGDLYLDRLGLVSATLSPDSMVWHHPDNKDKSEISIFCCLGPRITSESPSHLLLSEIYAVELLGTGSLSHCWTRVPLNCLTGTTIQVTKMHHFVVHSFQRSASQKGTWIPKSYVFGHPDLDVCRRWTQQIGWLLERDMKRPRKLLVIISPYSGKKKAEKTWEKVSPLFHLAGVNTQVLKTERARHAFDIIEKITDKELQALDGIVVVGGDGLFNEVLNGLVLQRHKVKYLPQPQDITDTLSGNSNFMNESEGQAKVNQRQKKQLVAHTELSSVPTPVAADLHPLLEDSTTLVSENSDFIKSSLNSGYSSEFASSTNNYDISGASEHSDRTNNAISNERFLNSVKFEEGGFILPSLTGASCKAAAGPKIEHAEMESDTSMLLPNLHFRLGIIPAGSTDSIVVSTTGSRDPITSALHIILGDSGALDVVRVTGWKSRSSSIKEEPRVRYAASFAGYGFYGDVIRESEGHRWMGPMRYDYAGTKVFMQHKSYEAQVSYLELPGGTMDLLSTQNGAGKEIASDISKNAKLSYMIRCCVNCAVCSKGRDCSNLDERPVSTIPVSQTPRWQSVRGRFLSVGAAVLSCRNDKAPDGVAAHAHLADGLLDLILIKDCSRPAYLWHLIQLTRKGANPLDLSFIEHHKTTQFTFISYGKESIWNVDGELFPAHQLSARVFRGLVNIFARGPEV